MRASGRALPHVRQAPSTDSRASACLIQTRSTGTKSTGDSCRPASKFCPDAAESPHRGRPRRQ
eukprot:892000-Alexandrium_andersonii.AAC.1